MRCCAAVVFSNTHTNRERLLKWSNRQNYIGSALRFPFHAASGWAAGESKLSIYQVYAEEHAVVKVLQFYTITVYSIANISE